jgi:hypothetical protein
MNQGLRKVFILVLLTFKMGEASGEKYDQPSASKLGKVSFKEY